jgi:hypothetical protein
MKCYVFGTVIPVTFFATFRNEVVVKLPIAFSPPIVKIGMSSFCLAYSLFCCASSKIAL